jgi:hypothetical protein
MSRFFAQLLLSIVLGVGAAVGFRSDVRGELNKTVREAKVSLHETAKITLNSAANVKTQVNTAVTVSAKANTNVKASIKDNAKADMKAKGNLQAGAGGNLLDQSLSDFSLDGSLNTNAQTTVGVDAEDLELDLKNQIKSALDVGLDILK